MSVLDQAFIRAYTKDAPSAAPPERSSEAQQHPSTNQPSAGAALAQPKVLLNTNSVFAGAVWHRADQSHVDNSQTSQPHIQIPVQQQQQSVCQQTNKTSLDPPEVSAAAPEFSSASAWVMPPAINPESASEMKAPSRAAQSVPKEPVTFGRIDAKQPAAIPAPHFSLAPTRHLGSRESNAVEVIAESTTDQLNENSAEHDLDQSRKLQDAKAVSVFNPAWEVPSIRWPRVCNDLCRVGAVTFDEIVDSLRDAIAQEKKIVAVTSQQRGEGRTSVSLCAARFAANAGINTILVDADFSNPQIAIRTEMNVDEGWEAVLTETSTPAESAVASTNDKLTILPLGKRARRCNIGLAELNETSVLSEITKSFDLVIVDTGPFPVEDANVFDAVLIVRDCRSTPSSDIDRLASQISAAGVEAMGVVENFG